jgi:hypothetical protein
MNITFNNNLCLLIKYAVVFEVCNVHDSNKCAKIIILSNKYLLNNEHFTGQDCIIRSAYELKVSRSQAFIRSLSIFNFNVVAFYALANLFCGNSVI